MYTITTSYSMYCTVWCMHMIQGQQCWPVQATHIIPCSPAIEKGQSASGGYIHIEYTYVQYSPIKYIHISLIRICYNRRSIKLLLSSIHSPWPWFALDAFSTFEPIPLQIETHYTRKYFFSSFSVCDFVLRYISWLGTRRSSLFWMELIRSS